jgi:hypothetical protein
MALERESVLERACHATGLVSRMTVRRDGGGPVEHEYFSILYIIYIPHHRQFSGRVESRQSHPLY